MAEIDYNEDRYCPVFKKVIYADWCWDFIMHFSWDLSITREPELFTLENIEEARKLCDTCPYSGQEDYF